MKTPATGLWGPGDYDGFRTLDKLILLQLRHEEEHTWEDPEPTAWTAEIAERSAVVEALLDLAHDLDARGLVLVPREPTEAMVTAGNGDCMSYFGDEPFPSFERGWASAIDAALT